MNESPKNIKTFGRKELWKGFCVILGNAFEYKKELVKAALAMALLGIIDPIHPYVFGKLIDAITSNASFAFGGHTFSVPLYGVLLATWAVVLLAQVTIERFKALSALQLQEFVRTNYIAKVSYHMLGLPMSFHKGHKSGEFQEKLTKAAGAVGDILAGDILSVLPQVITLVVSIFILFSFNPIFFYIVSIGIVVYVYVSIKMITPMVPLQRQSQGAYAKARGHLTDAITNVKVVKDFTSESYERAKIRHEYQNVAMSIWYKLMNIRRNTIQIQKIIILLTRLSTLILSIYLIRNGNLTLGSLVIANTYAMSIFGPLASISDNWRNIQNGIINIEDTEEILALKKEVYEPLNPAPITSIKGDISFTDVSFSYDGKKHILEHITFDVIAGQVVALVGESGVGKSSLIDILSAYHFPISGSVCIDNHDIRSIPLNILRHNIGVVTQEITLFNDSIRNNLRYGNFDKSEAEVMEAARKAHCLDFIEKFPEKWNQVVGERGLKLSVGQKQRIAIARAILKNPKILILDEPTSALDAGSEKIITESLEELMHGKTTFIVAHRLSTVRRANIILVFKDGRIVESGTHDELIKTKGGEYKRLYELQIGLHQ